MIFYPVRDLSNKNNKMSYLIMVSFDRPQPLQRREVRAYNIHIEDIKSPPLERFRRVQIAKK